MTQSLSQWPDNNNNLGILPVLGGVFGGNPKGGLANGGLAQKAPIRPKKALSGEFLLPPRGCEVQRNRSRSAPKRPR